MHHAQFVKVGSFIICPSKRTCELWPYLVLDVFHGLSTLNVLNRPGLAKDAVCLDAAQDS
jgi:hypothetical protein